MVYFSWHVLFELTKSQFDWEDEKHLEKTRQPKSEDMAQVGPREQIAVCVELSKNLRNMEKIQERGGWVVPVGGGRVGFIHHCQVEEPHVFHIEGLGPGLNIVATSISRLSLRLVNNTKGSQKTVPSLQEIAEEFGEEFDNITDVMKLKEREQAMTLKECHFQRFYYCDAHFMSQLGTDLTAEDTLHICLRTMLSTCKDTPPSERLVGYFEELAQFLWIIKEGFAVAVHTNTKDAINDEVYSSYIGAVQRVHSFWVKQMAEEEEDQDDATGSASPTKSDKAEGPTSPIREPDAVGGLDAASDEESTPTDEEGTPEQASTKGVAKSDGTKSAERSDEATIGKARKKRPTANAAGPTRAPKRKATSLKMPTPRIKKSSEKTGSSTDNATAQARSDAKMDLLVESLAALTRVVTNQQALQNNDRAKTVEVSEGEVSKSILNAWEQVDFETLRVLSVDPPPGDVSNVAAPSLSAYVQKLVSRQTKLAQTVSSLVHHAERERWLAFPSKFMIVMILRFGYIHPQIQSDNTAGFSCLMMKPEMVADYRQMDTKELQGELNQMFGNGDMSKEFLASVTKADLHIPKSLEEAVQQVEGAISFWDLWTSPNGFAADSYEFAKDFMRRNARSIRMAQSHDHTTLTRLLHTADVIFQATAERIRRINASDARHRVREALRRDLDGKARALWARTLANYDITQSLSHLALPGNLAALQHHGIRELVQSDDGVLRRRQRRTTKEDSDNEAEEPEPKIHASINTNVQPEFRLPEGTTIRKAFPPALQSQFPKVKFSNSQKKRGSKATPCLRFLCLGKCSNGKACPFSHLQPAQMADNDRAKCVELIAQAREAL